MYLLQHLDYTIKKLKSQTANLLTIINLCFGAFAIIFVLQHDFRTALFFIVIAAVFDRFDGMVARKYNIMSDLGKQLDSLCDIISFGVAPAILIHQAILFEFGYAGAFFTIIFIACSAIRLARFNVSETNGFFVGLPITAAGCLLTLSSLMIEWFAPFIFMFLTLLLSILMISTFKVKKL